MGRISGGRRVKKRPEELGVGRRRMYVRLEVKR